MFDVETYLKRNGVEARCARMVSEILGDRITLSALSSGLKSPGEFIVPSMNLAIRKNGFIFFKDNVKLSTDPHSKPGFKGNRVVATCIDGKLTIGEEYLTGNNMVTGSGKTVPESQIRYLEMPDGWLDGKEMGQYYYYDSKSVSDYYETKFPGFEAFVPEKQKIMLLEVLSDKDEMSKLYMAPDKEEKWSVPTTIYSQVGDIQDIISGKTNIERVMQNQAEVLSDKNFTGPYIL